MLWMSYCENHYDKIFINLCKVYMRSISLSQEIEGASSKRSTPESIGWHWRETTSNKSMDSRAVQLRPTSSKKQPFIAEKSFCS